MSVIYIKNKHYTNEREKILEIYNIIYPCILVVGKPLCDNKLARKSADRFVSTNTKFLFAPNGNEYKPYITGIAGAYKKGCASE